MKSINPSLFSIHPVYWRIFFFSVTIVVSGVEAYNRNDFLIYQLASYDLVHHINPYNHSYFDGYYYYYSLLFAYLIYPFTFFNSYWSTFLWLVLNSFFLYKILLIIAEYIQISRYSNKIQFMFYGLIILFNIRTIRENYHSAQVTLLILFLMVYALRYLWKQHYVYSALLLALAINIKLLALPLLAYCLYRGYFKTAIYTLVFTILLFLLPMLWMNKTFYMECMSEWWMLINPLNERHIIDTEERSFHSITTLLSTLLISNPPDIYALPIKRNILDLSVNQLQWVIQITRVIFIVSTLWIIRSLPFRKPKNEWILFVESAYVIALIPLIFPHQQHYAFLLQMPAISILIYYYLTTSSSKLLVSLIFIFLCFNLKILLGVFNSYYDHFKILTYGAIMVILTMQVISKRVKTLIIA